MEGNFRLGCEKTQASRKRRRKGKPQSKNGTETVEGGGQGEGDGGVRDITEAPVKRPQSRRQINDINPRGKSGLIRAQIVSPPEDAARATVTEGTSQRQGREPAGQSSSCAGEGRDVTPILAHEDISP